MNFNVKNCDKIDVMKRLINYGKVEESQANTGMLTPRLEYSAVAADGKTYGIIKECNKFYIKVAPPKNTELLAEDFQYIGGFMNKKDYEYPTYAIASKQFDFKLMSINEAHTIKKEITQFKKEEPADWQINETKEMRNELNRFNQIMQNVGIILNEDSNAVVNTNKVPEAPASHPSDKKVNSPFTEDTAVAKGDKDFDKTQTDPTKAGAPFDKEIKVTDKDMQSDKKPTENTDAVYTEKAKYVPDNSVADKKPSGGKSVKVNENKKTIKLTDQQLAEVKSQILAWNKDKNYMDTSKGTEIGSSAPFTDELGQESNQTESNTESIHEETVAHLSQNQNDPKPETGNVGDTAPFDKTVNEVSDAEKEARKAAFDDMNDFVNSAFRNTPAAEYSEEELADKWPTLFGSEDPNEEYFSYDDTKRDYLKRLFDEYGVEGDSVKWRSVEDDFEDDEPEEVEGMEQVEDIVDSIVRECVNEAKLDVFGKHPAYRKVPMTTPPNREVAPNGARDWNDKSVESDTPFGTKIGSSAPFDKKVMDMLVDAVMQKINFHQKA